MRTSMQMYFRQSFRVFFFFLIRHNRKFMIYLSPVRVVCVCVKVTSLPTAQRSSDLWKPAFVQCQEDQIWDRVKITAAVLFQRSCSVTVGVGTVGSVRIEQDQGSLGSLPPGSRRPATPVASPVICLASCSRHF